MPEKLLKTIQNLLLHSKKKVNYKGNIDRILNNSNTPAHRTDDNIDDRIAKFADIINNEKVYGISVRYFCDLETISYPVKINFKVKCSLETKMKKLFKLKTKSTLAGTPDVKIIFTNVPYMQYEQFRLNDNFRQYIKTIMCSGKILSMSIQKTPLQRTYEMSTRSQSFNIDFLGTHRQFATIVQSHK